MHNTILYLDDERENLNAFRFAFLREYHVLLANNSREAEDLLQKEPVKVIITDQRMPDENGTEFVKRIKAQYPSVVFILLTAYADIDVVIEAVNLGNIYRYVSKPWDKNEMKLTLENAIEKYELQSQNKLLIQQLQEQNELLKRNNLKLSEAKKKIEESEQEKNNLLNALNHATLVSITDLNGVIVYVNPAFCLVCGYSPEELIGQTHQPVNSGFHPKDYWAAMWKTIKRGEIWRGEVKNITKNGDYYWVDTVITPIRNQKGAIYQYMSIRYLITEKKELYEQREKLLEDLKEYAFQTSHNIRGPVARLLGLTQLLLQYENEPEETRQMIRWIGQTTQEMDQIIWKMNDILSRSDYSGRESN